MRLPNPLPFRKVKDSLKKTKSDENSIDLLKEVLFAHAVINKKGIFTQSSKELQQLTGFKKSEIKNAQIGKILSHSSIVKVRNLISNISHSSPFISTEINLIRKDQTSIPMELIFNFFTKENEELLFCIFRNMNPDRRLIAELFTLKEHYRLLAEHTSYVQILLDRDLKSIYISPSCKNLSGYSVDEAKIMNLFSLVHPDDFETFWDHMNNDNTPPFTHLRFRFKDKEDHFIPVECQISKILDQFGQPEYTVLNLHDITRQKMYELELIRAKKEAEAAHKMKNNFLASITHELRTPLNAIIGFARILEHNGTRNDDNNYLGYIESSGMQLLGIIDNLLEYARIENNELEIENEPVILNEFFRDLVPIIKNDLKKFNKDNLEMIGEWDIDLNAPEIYTNRGILKNIFTNLIDNAIKFTKEGYIRYGCRPYGIKKYLFFVEDSGIGIPEENKDLIFEKFTQIDQSLSREYGGTGLGLSVTKKFVELLNGEIWFISETGKGTSFYFTLPIS